MVTAVTFAVTKRTRKRTDRHDFSVKTVIGRTIIVYPMLGNFQKATDNGIRKVAVSLLPAH